MKKYLVIASVLFTVACNNNADQKAAEQTDTAVTTENKSLIPSEESIYGSPEFIDGKYEIINYIKEGKKLEFPNKIFIQFFKKGEIVDHTGLKLYYKIKADSIYINPVLANINDVASKITYTNAEKTGFILTNKVQNSAVTYLLAK